MVDVGLCKKATCPVFQGEGNLSCQKLPSNILERKCILAALLRGRRELQRCRRAILDIGELFGDYFMSV